MDGVELVWRGAGAHLLCAIHGSDCRSVVVQWVSAAPYPQVVEFGPWQPDAPPDLGAVRTCAAATERASAGRSGSGDGSLLQGVQVAGEAGIRHDSTQPVTCIEPLGDPSYLFRCAFTRGGGGFQADHSMPEALALHDID